MTQFCGTIPIDCTECAEISVTPCQSIINLQAGLNPGDSVYLWARDFFSNLYYVQSTVLGDGSVNLDVSDFPAGMFELTGKFFDVFFSTDPDGISVLPITVNSLSTTCIILHIKTLQNDEPMLLGKRIGIDMNSISDQLITLSGGSSFVVSEILLTNASTSLTAALDAQVWTGLNRSGVRIFYGSGDAGLADQVTGLTSATKAISWYDNFVTTIAKFIIVLGSVPQRNVSGTSLYFSLGTPQGAVATADIYVYGYILS